MGMGEKPSMRCRQAADRNLSGNWKPAQDGSSRKRGKESIRLLLQIAQSPHAEKTNFLEFLLICPDFSENARSW
jgi:hypothetical protein